MSEIFAILPAAGSGTRMGELTRARAKVLLPVQAGGPAILEAALRALVAAEVLSGVCVAARPEDLDEVAGILERVAPGLARAVVCGGETRQASVWNALQVIPAQAEFVLVHDAARPFVEPAAVQAVVAEARQSGAAILAAPSVATVKRVDAHGRILETLARDQIWLAETPQVFSAELLRAAHENAQKTGFLGTDEAELVEHFGRPVHVVQGPPGNLKITTAADIKA